MRVSRVLPVAIAVVLGGLLAGLPAATRACSGPLMPFLEAVRDSDAIARVTVVRAPGPWFQDPDRTEVFRVDRVLKGTLPSEVVLAEPWAHACGDSIGSYAGGEGKVAIVAFGVVRGAVTINPTWAEAEDIGIGGSAEPPVDARALADVEAAILAALGAVPAPREQNPLDATVVGAALLLVAVLLVGGALVGAARRTSRPPDPGPAGPGGRAG